ncbi:MAG: hypothetical protein MSH25_03165 [Desulfovibrio sp.]|uniref:hypothetical protein n=1 Tax=Desulfovibrio sp. TaxID=885 RepID=UPI0025C11909|nr:hypothetical protein [Desulfovibrio sp.]MCI7568364.1 hypothetical protein [Desulfovibrio sp.]
MRKNLMMPMKYAQPLLPYRKNKSHNQSYVNFIHTQTLISTPNQQPKDPPAANNRQTGGNKSVLPVKCDVKKEYYSEGPHACVEAHSVLERFTFDKGEKREAAAQRRPKKETHFSTPKRTMPGRFHNHDVSPRDDDAGFPARFRSRHPPE